MYSSQTCQYSTRSLHSPVVGSNNDDIGSPPGIFLRRVYCKCREETRTYDLDVGQVWHNTSD